MVPLFVLMLASLITLGIFYYNSFNAQCAVQREIVEELKNSGAPIKRVSRSTGLSQGISGLANRTMSFDYSTHAYAFKEGTILRTGEAIGELF